MSAFAPGNHPPYPVADVKAHEPELDPPFEVLEPAALASPLVFSSPHSGASIRQRFLASSRLDLATLRRSEDALCRRAVLARPRESGAPLCCAPHFPRAYLDLNREPYELDPRMFEGGCRFSPIRARSGSRAASARSRASSASRRKFMRERLQVDEALARIEKLYKPYHRVLRRTARRGRSAFRPRRSGRLPFDAVDLELPLPDPMSRPQDQSRFRARRPLRDELRDGARRYGRI